MQHKMGTFRKNFSEEPYFVADMPQNVLHMCNTRDMELSEYITAKSGKTLRQIALACGYQPSKLTRQLNGVNPLTMETVRDIARATGLNMLELFRRSGHLTNEEVQRLQASGVLHNASEQELADEILRRMQRGATYFDEHSPFEAPEGYALAADTDDQDDYDEGDMEA
ncbi:hypothetical protein VVR12_03155 [Rothia sp. LK2588]|uniref:hypothetical protein n=1 Tax=Rothia sp. LK2588 TaxID=3114369 RepID=UPI0034CECB98